MHQLDRKPTDRHTGPFITTKEFQSWEIRQYILHTETPGLFGYFGTGQVAA